MTNYVELFEQYKILINTSPERSLIQKDIQQHFKLLREYISKLDIKEMKRANYKKMSSIKQQPKNIVETFCVISNEEIRRIYCFQFPNLIATSGQIEEFIPNVCYHCTVKIKDKKEKEDLKQISSNRLKLKRITGVKFDEEADNFIAGAPWQPRLDLVDVRPWYPKSILPWSDQNKIISSECIVINEREVFIVHRPNHKGFIGFIVPNDFMYVDGRVLGCELYFCRYNNAYIIYGYYPHPESKGGIRELAWCTPMDIGLENPMKTRLKPGGVKEFLGYVKLCRFNHFFCTYCIPLISDPKNVLHGRVALGDSNNAYEKEKEQNIGIRVWLRFNSEKTLFRWEIVELFKATEKQPPLWARPLNNELEENKYVRREIDEEDDFHIPLISNYFISRHLLFDEEFGFVEDVDLKIIMFTVAYEESHPNTFQKERNVWCRENPDIMNRLVPFCVVDILEPKGNLNYLILVEKRIKRKAERIFLRNFLFKKIQKKISFCLKLHGGVVVSVPGCVLAVCEYNSSQYFFKN
ncbi:hypothetical protein Mgra_00005918 [Meloidogyne graminicola]|uniref:Uncharacterized protein n=1 Tax=Meloidogyne graminicola TaxID=189291 RepID=A0A8S9ZMN7_9BILA|nr:hypothetical protein Mgra_00005918 [Meloidogyne graminicola]